MKSTHRRRETKTVCTVSDFPDNWERAKSLVREFLRGPGGVRSLHCPTHSDWT